MSSKSLEIEEKTIDGAIEKACREFGVVREKLNIEIISEGSSGFLGLGAKKAKIRASLLALDMDFSMSSQTSVKEESRFEAPKPETRQDAKKEPRRETRRDSKHEPKTDAKPQTKHEPRHKTEQRPAKPSPSRAQAPLKAQPAVSTNDLPEEETAQAPQALPASTPAALKAQDLLSGILSRMTFACQVTATETDDTIILSIAGDDSGLLIGRRGQNLDALQYILSKAVNKSDTERKMIVVDSEEYRKRRQESLLGMAERIRDKVKRTQKPLSLAHMNAHDRRIIHLALQEDESLVTKSRGEGEYRKVIVLPAKKSGSERHPKTRNKQ